MKCDGGNAGCGWPIQPKAVECVNLATTRPTGSSKSVSLPNSKLSPTKSDSSFSMAADYWLAMQTVACDESTFQDDKCPCIVRGLRKPGGPQYIAGIVWSKFSNNIMGPIVIMYTCVERGRQNVLSF